MRLVITGGCGFVGANLVFEALMNGYEVTVVDNLSRLGSEENLTWLSGLQHPGRLSFVKADVRNASEIEEIIRRSRPDGIFHLAGQVAMTTSISRPRDDFETNALGTLNVLEALRQYAKDSLIVYSSTNKVYGNLETVRFQETLSRYVAPDYPSGFDEGLCLDFHSPYGCSKGAADQYVLDYCRIFQVRGVVFRHSSIYGGRQYATYDQGWVGWFVRQALLTLENSRHRFTISGNGKQVRDLLNVDDVTTAYFAALRLAEKAAGHAFNLGGGMDNSLSLLELFSSLEQTLGVTLQYDTLPVRTSDQKIFVSNNKKFSSFTNWQPRINIKDGIQEMIRWEKSIADRT